MIVKNEMANLDRCLTAIAPHIDCWVIGDTGSNDGTPGFIKSFFAAHGLPGELHNFQFENFEQARNAALDHAYASDLPFEYLLFADADMELVVEDPGFRCRLAAGCYRLLQRSSHLAYWNARIVRRDLGARYRGVTHEYLDGSGDAVQLSGVWYRDHATGSNRKDKFERDIRLLEDSLRAEPENARYWFYLAQSLRDAGRTREAADAYAKRAEMGGWAEEAWHARLSEGRCRKALGDDGGFLKAALAAYESRPERAESLYDLAKHYRELGMNEAGVLFAEAGLRAAWPAGDSLFIEDPVYSWGLKQEFSITAYYSRDAALKARGAALCNELALDRAIPEGQRELARQNLRFYVQPAAELLPSFSSRPIPFTPPDGWRPMNPSVTRDEVGLVSIVRTVNYLINARGQYDMPPDQIIRTRNYLVRLSEDFVAESAVEIFAPADMPPPAFPPVQGFEDMRLFSWRGDLWCSSTVRELRDDGLCEQVLAKLERRPEDGLRLSDWRPMRPAGPRRHQKNWMPMAGGDTLRFVYLCDPGRIVDEAGGTVAEFEPNFAADAFRGGTQAIVFDEGWLALVHEVPNSAYSDRSYQHRFVYFDTAGRASAVSAPFFFNKRGVEFAAGLTWSADKQRLLISYGVDDREAWIGSVESGDVRSALATAKTSSTLLAGEMAGSE